NLAMINDRFLIHEKIFNWVFDRDDMNAFALIDEVEHGGNGRAFAAPRHPGQDDHALIEMTEFLDARGQPQLFESRNLVFYAGAHAVQVATLLEPIDAKAALVFANDMSEVGPTRLFQNLAMVLGDDRIHEPLHFLFGERLHFHLPNDAAQTHHR